MEKVFLAKIELIRPIIRWIRERLEGVSFGKKTVKKIELAVEEALVNIVRHAYLGKPKKVTIGVAIHPKEIEIVIRDSGPPFDPLLVKPPNIEGDFGEREIGGLGIMMMRQNMDDIRYRREGKMNILTLVKRKSIEVSSIPPSAY